MENTNMDDIMPEDQIPNIPPDEEEAAGPEDISLEMFSTVSAAPTEEVQDLGEIVELPIELRETEPSITDKEPVEDEPDWPGASPEDIRTEIFEVSGEPPAVDEPEAVDVEAGDSGETTQLPGTPDEPESLVVIQELDEEEPAWAEAEPTPEIEDQAGPHPTDETAVDHAIPVPGEPAQRAPRKKRRFAWLLTTLLGLLALILIAVISAYRGYLSGIELRQDAERTQVAQVVKEQYDLALQDLEQKEYYRARQRFEYVIELDPSHAGAMEKLADALFWLNVTATPTLVPTPTLTPTPDLRTVQELFDQGQQYLNDGNWASAIDALLSLRKADPLFRVVEVDGMLFLALRNQGRDKILIEADLEGGIYDLTLAERLGPLDAEVQGLLDWTSLYITGASFWEIDWAQAVYYFGQVAPNLPNLRDKSNVTAMERYRTALIQYGYQLADEKKWCQSAEQFQLALQIAYDGETDQSFKVVAERCEQAKQTQQAPPPQP